MSWNQPAAFIFSRVLPSSYPSLSRVLVLELLLAALFPTFSSGSPGDGVFCIPKTTSKFSGFHTFKHVDHLSIDCTVKLRFAVHKLGSGSHRLGAVLSMI